jgi:hypothetical protein
MLSDLEAVEVAEMRGWWPVVARWGVAYCRPAAYGTCEVTDQVGPSEVAVVDLGHHQDFGESAPW